MKPPRSFQKKTKKKPRKSGGRRAPAAAGERLLNRRNALIGLGVFVGSIVAGYIFSALFIFPAPLIQRDHEVPRVIEMATSEARDALTGAGFTPLLTQGVNHPSAPRGEIVWQDPPPELLAPEGSTVEITASIGPARVQVPDVAGYDLATARLLLEAAGFQVTRIERAPTPVAIDVAVNTRPSAGNFLNPSSSVTLIVSDGAATINVPGVIGLELDSARVRLEEAGLLVGRVTRQSAFGRTPGLVFIQNPAAGTLVTPETIVDLVIARELDQ